MRQFYSLPNPKEAGLKWREYERARAKVARIEERHQEAQNKRARVEQDIRDLDDTAVRELAVAVLAGEDDPADPHDEHARLVAKLRDLRREEQAVSQALPQAEEELRLTIFEHQHRWIPEADRMLQKAIAEERKAYEKAQRLIEEPRRKRLYAESLARWVRYPEPSFSAGDSDVAIPSLMQNLTQDVYSAEERMQERAEAEQLQAQEQEGVA